MLLVMWRWAVEFGDDLLEIENDVLLCMRCDIDFLEVNQRVSDPVSLLAADPESDVLRELNSQPIEELQDVQHSIAPAGERGIQFLVQPIQDKIDEVGVGS